MRGFWLLLTAVLAPQPSHAEEKPTDPAGRSFYATFETLDEEHWYVSDGWTNGDHQDCVWTRRNLTVSEGSLQLSLTDTPAGERAFSCAELQSKELYGYGTYETRMRAAAGNGLVTAFFTYIGPPHQPRHDEIDFEFLGKSHNEVQLNYFADGKGGHENIVPLGLDATNSFNDYAFQWSPDSLRWFVNGELVAERRREAGQPFPESAAKIYVSLWNGIGRDMRAWLKSFTYPGKPLVASYRYIAFTAAGEPCQFATSIVCAIATQDQAK